MLEITVNGIPTLEEILVKIKRPPARTPAPDRHQIGCGEGRCNIYGA